MEHSHFNETPTIHLLVALAALAMLSACKTATCPGGVAPVDGLCQLGDGGADGAVDAAGDANPIDGGPDAMPDAAPCDGGESSWFCKDADDDDYFATIQACSPPSNGYFFCSPIKQGSLGWELYNDCDDTDDDVHPKQLRYFAEPRSNGTFDYNCDGEDTPQWPDNCFVDPVAGGWRAANPIPACGHQGEFSTKEYGCGGSGDYRDQACR